MPSATLVLLFLLLPAFLIVSVAGQHEPPCHEDEEVPSCKPCVASCDDDDEEDSCPKTCEKTTHCFCKEDHVWKEEGKEGCVPRDSCPNDRRRRDTHGGGHGGMGH